MMKQRIWIGLLILAVPGVAALGYLGGFYALGELRLTHGRSLLNGGDERWTEKYRHFSHPWQTTIFEPLIEWETSHYGRTPDLTSFWDDNDAHETQAIMQALENSLGTRTIATVIPGPRPIIHIRDWRLVSQDDLALATSQTDADLEALYAEHLETVHRVQQAQKQMLSRLEDRMVTLCVDSLSGADPTINVQPAFERVRAGQRLTPQDELELMKIGAARTLQLEGELGGIYTVGQNVPRPHPLTPDGSGADLAANEAREDEIVRKVGGGCVLILGGAHDLSDNIERLGKKIGYIVVTPQGYPE
jgi:hypothetical protein